MSTHAQQAARAFAGIFATSLARSLSEATREPVLLKVADAPDPGTSQASHIQFRVSAEGGLRGECFADFAEAQVAELGAKALGTSPAPFNDAQADAFLKALSSSMLSLSAGLSAEHGPTSFKVDRVLEQSFDKAQLVPLAVVIQETAETPASLYLDRQLMDSLTSAKSASGTLPAADPIESGNLKLVMDVELNVSLRFGQRQLPLREVLELSSGSVIELDCQVDEPIDLLLDGKVIARGEAVIVDGNYGLRVTEIPQPMSSHFSR